MTARKDPPGAAFASIRDTRCSTCARILVEQRRWNAMPKKERKQLGDTHARHYGGGLCHTCATWSSRRKDDPPADLAYRGGWVRKGLILVPAGPRPVDTPMHLAGGPPRQPINHGTESGYSTHRKRGEQACAECKTAHSEAVKRRAARKKKAA